MSNWKLNHHPLKNHRTTSTSSPPLLCALRLISNVSHLDNYVASRQDARLGSGPIPSFEIEKNFKKKVVPSFFCAELES